jgi:hypothetical protein
MNDIHLHIIAFDIPYPPLYGGVIDVFYQIKSLSEAGVLIHLHAFEYGKGYRAKELEKMCFSVQYYPRITGLLASISRKPYITSSRKSNLMLAELMKDNYPILFEGLHTCYHITDKRLSNRLKLVRATNVEHLYYAHLALAERNIFRKIYFIKASIKLRYYQQVLKYADIILPVSYADSHYFQKIFPSKKVLTLPCFHANNEVVFEKGGGNYVLFQGNLEVAENERAAIFLIRKVMNDIDYPFIIAGKSPSVRLSVIASQYPNVSIVGTPDEETMNELIRKAHINLLITFQATGLKLKLLNALYLGNMIIANNKMLHGTGLDALCYIANTPEEMKKQVKQLIKSDYSSTKRNDNFSLLLESYNNKRNATTLFDLIKNHQSE